MVKTENEKVKKLVSLIKDARFVFVCGNGGSAAAAEHFAIDLMSRGIKAICLDSNISAITMISNDFGYEFVFSKQLEIFAIPDDLLITISCSGKSQNILKAQTIAKKIGMKIFIFETFGKVRNYEKLEEKHLKFIHKVKKELNNKKWHKDIN